MPAPEPMRVLVTRARAEAERTAQRLRALGHAPLVAPILRLEATGEPPPQGHFDALMLTSAKAASFLGAVPGRSVPLFAVGPRTAAAARAQDFSDIRTAGGDAASLAQAVAESLPPGARLLHVAGRDRKDEPAAALTAWGFVVTSWSAYRAAAATRLPLPIAEALRGGEIDAALHYSRRSADLLIALADAAGLLAELARLRHRALSPDATAPLLRAGFPDVQAAPEPNETALLRVL